MRRLLESSWMKFGPAGRGTYDWVTGAPPTSIEKQLQSYHWNELNSVNDPEPEAVFYIILPTASLLCIGILAFLVYKRYSRGKLSSANVITLDFQDAESNAEILSSLTWDAEQFPTPSSDLSDGVFLMVYLPPPYEETLTKITRAASSSSSRNADAASRASAEEGGRHPSGGLLEGTGAAAPSQEPQTLYNRRNDQGPHPPLRHPPDLRGCSGAADLTWKASQREI